MAWPGQPIGHGEAGHPAGRGDQALGGRGRRRVCIEQGRRRDVVRVRLRAGGERHGVEQRLAAYGLDDIDRFLDRLITVYPRRPG